MNKTLLIIDAGTYGVLASKMTNEMSYFEKIDFISARAVVNHVAMC